LGDPSSGSWRGAEARALLTSTQQTGVRMRRWTPVQARPVGAMEWGAQAAPLEPEAPGWLALVEPPLAMAARGDNREHPGVEVLRDAEEHPAAAAPALQELGERPVMMLLREAEERPAMAAPREAVGALALVASQQARELQGAAARPAVPVMLGLSTVAPRRART
jgi:hypothetical protein